MIDRFWEWFGKGVAVTCALFTLLCAVGFLWVLAEDYHDQQTKPWAVVAPDTTHHPKGAK